MSPCNAHATDDVSQGLPPFFLVVVCHLTVVNVHVRGHVHVHVHGHVDVRVLFMFM